MIYPTVVVVIIVVVIISPRYMRFMTARGTDTGNLGDLFPTPTWELKAAKGELRAVILALKCHFCGLQPQPYRRNMARISSIVDTEHVVVRMTLL